MSGYWDLTASYDKTYGNEYDNNKTLYAISFVPMFRLQRHPFANSIAPFIELGVGGAILSRSEIGGRSLGSNLSFDDRAGVGFRFGEKQQYGLSVYYNHFSNASLAKPNQGIDATYSLAFRYYFN